MLEWSPWFRLILGIFATWRLSHLLAYEDGPFDAVVRARHAAGDSVIGRLMDCPYCLSLWIAAPMALTLSTEIADWFVAWLAISGGGSLLEKLSQGRSSARWTSADLAAAARNEGLPE